MKNEFKDIAWVLFRTETTMSETETSKPKLTGRVKWFNNKTGFGFITALEGSEGVRKDTDVFVHHSTIKVAQEQYRYLVQGEYVEFVISKIVKSGDSKHEFQADDVSGVKGGKLICETRLESRVSAGTTSGGSRFKHPAEDDSSSNKVNKDASGSDWTTVTGRKSSSTFAPRQAGSGGQWRRGGGERGRGRGGRGGATASSVNGDVPPTSSE